MRNETGRRDKAVLAFFASLNASTASEAKNVPPIDRRGFLTPSDASALRTGANGDHSS